MMLFIICTILLSLHTLNAHPDFPTLWNEAPSSIDEYPFLSNCSTSESKCRLINPWLYLDRLGLYKILISVTTPLMPFSRSSNVSNILFGLPSQFGWQFDSNRLFSNGTRNVSTNSWWASANYYLSVIPFLAAVDAGIIQQTSFQLVQYENFCSSSEQCFRQVPEAMTAWRLFFVNLSQSNSCRSEHVDDRLIDQCYLGPLWSAHLASLDHALPLIASKVSLLPSRNEQQFGLAWANIVAFIGLSRKNTNLVETKRYQDEFFPSRILADSDHPPHCPDLPETVNQGLALLFAIQPQWYPEMMKMWRKATCNYEARQDAQRVLETAAVSKLTAAAYYSEAVVKAQLFPCDQ